MTNDPMIRFNATSELFEISHDKGVTWVDRYQTATDLDHVHTEAGRNYNPKPSVWSRYEGWLVAVGLVVIGLIVVVAI